MTLGERLVRLRNQKGLSQDALAEALGVSRQSVSKWETDASIPELDKLIKLSNLFEITLDELVRGESVPTVPPVPFQAPEKVSWTQKAKQLYQDRAYLLGWLMVVWWLLDIPNSIRAIAGYWAGMGWESTLRFLQVMSYSYLFDALKLLLGLFIVIRGRRFAGQFRWYHLGWIPVILGVFGCRPIPLLRSSPLEMLLAGLLLYSSYGGFDSMVNSFSLWPENLGNLLVCILGLLMLTLGRRRTEHRDSRS